jgi:hypothetical protein
MGAMPPVEDAKNWNMFVIIASIYISHRQKLMKVTQNNLPNTYFPHDTYLAK